MSKKRWFALLGAVILLIVSIISQVGTSVATTDWNNVFNQGKWSEKTIKNGSGGKKIAVIPIEGTIQDEGEGSLLSANSNSYNQFMKSLEHAGKDDGVNGIIIKVNSPGGGVVESANIHDKVKEIQDKQKKPVYVSMGNTAASGGYYLSAPADKIVAHPATLTGSIGVIMESIDYSDLAKKLGVDFNTIKSGKHKDIMSPERKMTKKEHKILQTMIDENYDEFVNVIVEGRGLDEDTVRKLGDGRVYTGKQAKKNGLVDELGSLDDTITMMENDQKWNDAKAIKYKDELGFDSVLGATAQKVMNKDAKLDAVQELMKKSDSPRAMYLYSE